MLIAPILLSFALLSAQEPAPETAPAPAEVPALVPELLPLPEGVAARVPVAEGEPTLITFAELDTVLVQRHGKRNEGNDVLARMMNMAVLRELSLAAGVTITGETIDARIAELNKRLLDDGYAGGIAAQLIDGDIDPKVFRDAMGVSLAQEELTRIALKMKPGSRPDGGQQTIWLDEAMSGRTNMQFGDPFPTDMAATLASSDEAKITMGEYCERLRNELPREFVEQAISQLVLLKRLHGVAGELNTDIWKEARGLEILRRRERHAANPQYAGVTFEALLDAQGLDVATILVDPSVQVTALTTLLAWRQAEAAATSGDGLDERRESGLRALYEAEKELFDGYYGEQLNLHMLLLRANEIPSEEVPRSLDDAREYLTRLAGDIPDLESFRLMVGKLSDDAAAAQTKGDLGWYGRGNERLPENIRNAVFEAWGAKQGPTFAGPLDVPGGVALLWISEHMPAPDWATLKPSVQSELQARFINQVMPTGGVQIFRDPPPRAK